MQVVSNIRTRTGLQSLLDQPFRFLGGRVGLITNHSAVTSDLTHILDALLAAGVEIRGVFGPEHGVRGELNAGQAVPAGVDSRTGIPVYSLYGQTRKPTAQMLSDVDVILFDIQDVGARFYTYVQTMAYAMQAASEQGLPFVVLDRPNPIGGEIVEGPILDPQFSSFMGAHPIPIRYGMTMGELATYLNQEHRINADLTVVKLEGWQRDMWYEETGLPWVPPSPAMPTVDTAAVYPGFCLFEGTNVSEGRGTTKPFEVIGAPWIDGDKLAKELNAVGLIGAGFRPLQFVPAFSKYSEEMCCGIQVHVLDRRSFRPFAAAITAIDIIHQLWPDEFEFLPPPESGRFHFDLLVGTDKVRQDLLSGRPAPAIVGDWQHRLSDFLSVRSRYLMY